MHNVFQIFDFKCSSGILEKTISHELERSSQLLVLPVTS